MKTYMGVKLIQAEVMNLGAYNTLRGWPIPSDEDPTKEGYLVIYPDGYRSWSPKGQFEEYYFALANPTRISPVDINCMVASVEVSKLDPKTTLVGVELVTGFKQYATSACVAPENYDESIGRTVALKKVEDNIWFAMGFVLQWANYGLKRSLREVPQVIGGQIGAAK